MLNFWRVPSPAVLHRGCSLCLPSRADSFWRVHYLRTELNSPGTKAMFSADAPERAAHRDSHKATQSTKHLGTAELFPTSPECASYGNSARCPAERHIPHMHFIEPHAKPALPTHLLTAGATWQEISPYSVTHPFSL